MLITCLSMPRTGSVWWGEYQKILHSDSIILHEPFNYSFYCFSNGNRRMSILNEYKEGAFWKNPNLETGNIDDCYHERNLHHDQLCDKWEIFIKEHKNTVICRNHIIPMKNKYLEFLSNNSSHVFYTYRENIHEQIASYAIGAHTREFVCYDPKYSNNNEIFKDSIIAGNILTIIESFSNEIKNASHIVEKYFPECEWIKYEDMPFDNSIEGLPLKQNASAFHRLSDVDKNIINEIIK